MRRPILRSARHAAIAAAVVILVPIACVPYTVGSTAQTVPRGEVRRAGTMYIIPNAVEVLGELSPGAARGSTRPPA